MTTDGLIVLLRIPSKKNRKKHQKYSYKMELRIQKNNLVSHLVTILTIHCLILSHLTWLNLNQQTKRRKKEHKMLKQKSKNVFIVILNLNCLVFSSNTQIPSEYAQCVMRLFVGQDQHKTTKYT
mgnify:CR=1 FL=1